MISVRARAVLLSGLATAAVVLMPALASPAHADSHPLLKSLEGTWQGGGTTTPGPGEKSERLRCRADHTLAGENRLRQSFKCAGTTFRLNGSGVLTYDPASKTFSGTISGGGGQTSFTGRDAGAKTLRLKLEHSGYKDLQNTTGTATIRILGPNKHTMVLTSKDKKTGRSFTVLNATYTK